MGLSSEPWRDRVLLVSAWLIALGAAVATWAAYSRKIGVATGVFGSKVWADLLFAFHVVVPFVILLLPALAWAIGRTPAARARLGAFAGSKERTPLLLACLALLGLLQPLYFIEIGRVGFTVSFVATLDIVLIALLLLWGPSRPAAPVTVLGGGWVLIELQTRMTLETLLSTVVSQPELSWAKAWAGVFIASFVLWIIIPIWLMIPRLRVRASLAASTLARPALVPAAFLFVTAAAVSAWYRASGADVTALWPLQRFLGSISILAAGWIMFALLHGRPQAATTLPASHRPGLLWGGLAVVGVLYLVQAVRIARAWLYYFNPDGVAYLIIGRDFGRGLFVIRGTWSPLLPALVAPAVWLGGDPQVAQRVLAGAIGLAWAGAAVRLGRRVGLRDGWSVALGASMALIALQNAFHPITPDMLGAFILALYFLLVTSERFLTRPVLFGALAGVLGALAFYAQFYNLPFFLVHLLLTCALLVLNGERLRKALLAVIVAWGVAAVFVAPWVMALRARYGYITLSTTGAITHAVDGPSQKGHPCWDQKLCGSPSDVLIPWEDPQLADYVDRGWNVLGSWNNLRYQILHTQGNLNEYLGDMAFEFGPLPPLGLIVSLAALFLAPMGKRLRFLAGWGLLTAALYASGYMLFHIELRFFFPLVPIAIVAVFRCLQAFTDLSASAMAPTTGRVAGVLIVLAALLTFLHPGDAGLGPLPPDNRCVADTTAQFADKLVAPIAGSDKWINIIAYYSEKRTLGVLPPWTSASSADAQFRELGVRTFVVGQGLKLGMDLLARGDYAAVAETNLCGDNYLVLRTPIR